MAIGVVGEKCRMTRIFDESGASIPVTPVLVIPNRITQIKTKEKDGYTALQLAYGEVKASRVSKPKAGHYAKAGVLPGKGLCEFAVSAEESAALPLGSEVTIDLFKVGQAVDVTGITKGRGFTGVITRWNFSSQRASHGNSLSHNAPGSIGQNQSPGRVFKGKKMAGHYGNTRQTIQNLQIVRIDTKRNMLLIKGAVPGAKGGMLIVCPSVKQGGA